MFLDSFRMESVALSSRVCSHRRPLAGAFADETELVTELAFGRWAAAAQFHTFGTALFGWLDDLPAQDGVAVAGLGSDGGRQRPFVGPADEFHLGDDTGARPPSSDHLVAVGSLRAGRVEGQSGGRPGSSTPSTPRRAPRCSRPPAVRSTCSRPSSSRPPGRSRPRRGCRRAPTGCRARASHLS